MRSKYPLTHRVNDLISASSKIYIVMYADHTTIYSNLEELNADCVEAEITNKLHLSTCVVN